MTCCKSLERTVAEVGKHAQGIVAVEVWVLDNQNGLLIQPAGGELWVDPKIKQDDALARLNKPNHPRYVGAPATAPGVDVAGTVFVDCPKRNGVRRRKTSRSILREAISCCCNCIYSQSSGSKVSCAVEERPIHKLQFRNIQSLNADLDTVKTERLVLMEKAGFVDAVGVSFDASSDDGVQKKNGIVVYYTGKDENTRNLRSISNQIYLIRSTESIGNVLAGRLEGNSGLEQ